MKKRLFASACVVATTIAIVVVGCGKKGANSSLPPAQAAAAEALNAKGVETTVTNGEVTYVDFFYVRGVPELMVHLKAFPKLEKINFSSCDVTDDSLVNLAGLSELQEVALNLTKVSDKGIAHLAGLKNLKILNLNNDPAVSDQALEHLKNMPELVQLHLIQTQVSDAGIKHLENCKKLSMLTAYTTKVTKAGADEFRKTHPDAEVGISETETKDAAGKNEKIATPEAK